MLIMQHRLFVDTYNSSTLYITVVAVLVTFIYYFFKKRGLPPGPIGLPYLGYYPFLTNDTCHLQLQEFVRKYGDVSSFTVTGRLYINLGSFRALREAHVSKSEYFSKRVEDFTTIGHVLRDGVTFLNGELWKINRKFFVKHFRDRGMSSFKSDMNDGIYVTIQETDQELRNTKEQAFDIVKLLTNKCTKVLYQIVFGERGITIQEINDLNDLYENVLGSVVGRNMLLNGNIARYLMMPFMPKLRNAMKDLSLMENKMYKIINKQKRSFNGAIVRNVIDAYLKEKLDRQFKKDSSSQYFTDQALMGTLVQVVGDSVTTVSAFISSLFQAVVEHPEEQEEIYKELITVLGEDRDPTMDDKSKLSYTNAFISEVLRTYEGFPFFPKMECTREANISGYRIPKGAITIMNIRAAHYDPNVYEEPEKFNPSRFMPTEGMKKPEQPVQFGIGKRACIGEGFVMAQGFLFLATIVKNFFISKPIDAKNDSLLFLIGHFHICARPRK